MSGFFMGYKSKVTGYWKQVVGLGPRELLRTHLISRDNYRRPNHQV